MSYPVFNDSEVTLPNCPYAALVQGVQGRRRVAVLRPVPLRLPPLLSEPAARGGARRRLEVPALQCECLC